MPRNPILVFLENHADISVLRAYKGIFRHLHDRHGYDTWTFEGKQSRGMPQARQEMAETIRVYSGAIKKLISSSPKCINQLQKKYGSLSEEKICNLPAQELVTLIYCDLPELGDEMLAELALEIIRLPSRKVALETFDALTKFLQFHPMDHDRVGYDLNGVPGMIARNPTMVANVRKAYLNGAKQIVTVGKIHLTGFITGLHKCNLLNNTVFIDLRSKFHHAVLPQELPMTSTNYGLGKVDNHMSTRAKIFPQLSDEWIEEIRVDFASEISDIERRSRDERLPLHIYSFVIQDANDFAYLLPWFDETIVRHNVGYSHSSQQCQMKPFYATERFFVQATQVASSVDDRPTEQVSQVVKSDRSSLAVVATVACGAMLLFGYAKRKWANKLETKQPKAVVVDPKQQNASVPNNTAGHRKQHKKRR